MTTTASKNIVFGKSILNTEDHHYDFRVLADGRRVVNVWHYGDDTAGHGIDMAVSDFVAEYGCWHACQMAWIEYIQSRKEQTPLGQPNTLAPSSTNPLVCNSAGAGHEQRPGSVIPVGGWDYERNYHVAQTAIRYEAQVTDLVLAQLKAAGIQLYHLVTKDGGNRYRAAWDLLEDGKYSFTGQPDTALLVASNDPKHPEPYRVWTNGAGRQCDCRDHSQRMEQHGGFCKHVLLLEIIQAVAVAYRLNNPVPPTATATTLVA